MFLGDSVAHTVVLLPKLISEHVVGSCLPAARRAGPVPQDHVEAESYVIPN